MEVDFNYKEVADNATKALSTWGYECECKVETRQIIAVKVISRNGVELDSQKRIFRLCATEDLTRGPSGRHRTNYFEWREGLAKFSSANFWISRKGAVRGALSDAELASSRQYEAFSRGDRSAYYSEYEASFRGDRSAYKAEYHASHRAEAAAYAAAYRASHRNKILAYDAAYNASHRDQMHAYDAKRLSQLWTNGTETLKWSTLKHRGRKPDLLAQGWHPIE